MKMKTIFIATAFSTILMVSTALAVPVDYRINFGDWSSLVTGGFTVDDSMINSSMYGTTTGAVGLSDFILNYNGTVYTFNAGYTAAIVSPSIQYIMEIGSNGDITDIKGAFTIPVVTPWNQFNSFVLGRESDGYFYHIQQWNSANAGMDFSGSYTVERVTPVVDNTPVPEPSTVVLLSAGLLGVIVFARRQKKVTFLAG